jgi:lipoprotein-releasing system permease protein
MLAAGRRIGDDEGAGPPLPIPIPMRFELYIALRYLFARRKQAFISLISFISMLGVAVGVMALIIALALMTGLQGELRDRILGSTAHVYVWKVAGITDYQAEVDRLVALPRVVGAAPAILGQAMITAPGADSKVISFKGIDPRLEGRVTDIESALVEGHLDALGDDDGERRPGILIGRNLAEQLGLGVGDEVQLLTPQATVLPFGARPTTRIARIAGIYALGLYEYDAGFGFVSLDFARRLGGRDSVDLIQLRVDDLFAAPRVAADVMTALGPDYVAQDWQQQNQALFSALWLEKMGLSIAIGLIVTVAALNIVASLILLVMEKSRDIAILKTMGTSSPRVMRIFMLQGLIIGLVGTTIGAIGGVGLSWVLDTYRIITIPMDVYQVSHLPFVVQPLDFAIVVVAAVIICFLATIYPSRQASRLDPVQALRYE